MKRTMNAKTIAAAALCAVALAGCTPAVADQPRTDESVFDAINDRTCHELTLQREAAKRAHAMSAWNERQAEREAAEAAAVEEAEQFTDYGYWIDYTPSQPAVVRGNPDGLNTMDGVFEFNGHTETYYSTPAVYDGGLTVDEQGFYRTADGYYVVASSEHAEGEHVQISQGEAVVMDSGPEAGVIDVHTAW